MKSYIREIVEYTFSNTPAAEDNIALDMFINEIACVHGVSGKFMEKIICHRFGIDALDEKIHDFDGEWFGRPVEIKLETANQTSKMNMLSSYGKEKEAEYREVKPIIINCAMDPSTGKLLWVVITDTALLTDDSALWTALSMKTPRTSLSNYSEDDLAAIKVPYTNSELCYENKDQKFTGDKACINPKMWALLELKGGL